MIRNTTCSECGGTMQEGYILDFAHGGTMLQSTWVEGKPKHSFWLGLKVRDEQKHYITAYRCKICGLLKLYADLVTDKK